MVIRLDNKITINLNFRIASFSGPNIWMPASSDILTNDTNRRDPLMIKQIIKQLDANKTTFDPAVAWHLRVVKLK